SRRPAARRARRSTRARASSRATDAVRRREFVGALAAAGLAAGAEAIAQDGRGTAALTSRRRRGRIRQGLWKVNFGEDTSLSFDEMCRFAAGLGVHGFDLIPPEEWPTLRRHGLAPLLAGSGPVTFEDGI